MQQLRAQGAAGGLVWRELVQSRDDPVLAVALTIFRLGTAQFFLGATAERCYINDPQ